MSQSSSAPKIAVSNLFRGRNQGTELLIGREKELTAIDAAWNGADKKNIATIVAWGGVGKTSLVAHWAAKQLAQPDHSGLERYFDWSFYSQGTCREGDATGASHAASADLFLKEALEFFGDAALAASNADAWQKGERLAGLISLHRTLLILDGLEPLQDARTGELRDDGLRALLRGLAAHNRGLCLVTTRQHLPDLNTWRQTTAPEWELARLTDEAGAALLTRLGVNGTDAEKRDLSARVRGHALTLTLLGRYLKRVHRGDIRRADRVDFQKVNEKEQGGHAFRVMVAYERWFEENNCKVELAILRMLGLFDRPATPDCLVALCNPPIPGLSNTIASLREDDWNEAVTHLVELNLVEEQPWEPRHIKGYCEEEVRLKRQGQELGEPKRFSIPHAGLAIPYSLDAHPLIREFFAKQLQTNGPADWKSAHSRLFEHLQISVPYWPEGIEGLQALYQAVVHGCRAGMHKKASADIYFARIQRGNEYFSGKKLGAIGADLAAIALFFEEPWSHPVRVFSETEKAWLFNEAAFCLRATCRLTEAIEPMRAALELTEELKEWRRGAVAASNLSDLNLTLGDIDGALVAAMRSEDFASRCSDTFSRITAYAAVAGAMHHAGRDQEAEGYFRKAQGVQGSILLGRRVLHSLPGFRYRDWFLGPAERDAWRRSMGLAGTNDWSFWERPQHRCWKVQREAGEALEGKRKEVESPVLDVAFEELNLGRAALYDAILSENEVRHRISLQTAHDRLNGALERLRKSGEQIWTAVSMLSLAWLHCLENNPLSARADLDQAQQIAERGLMRLHLADIHLHRGRLFRDKVELKRARALIEQCAYWRRKQELDDAEEAAMNWS